MAEERRVDNHRKASFFMRFSEKPVHLIIFLLGIDVTLR
jgi:hypothetical protein